MVSQDTKAELIETLAARFGFSNVEVTAISATYFDYCTEVAIPEHLPDIPRYRDETDQPFLTLAYATHAEYWLPKTRTS